MTPYDYCLLAAEAYTAAPDIGKVDSASRAIVRETRAGLVIAFTGTDNIEGWLADLDVLTVDVPGAGEIHAGFYNAWKAIEATVLAAIGEQPVTFVGHSLGAALAVVAAVSLSLAGNPPVAVFGFEPPRVSPGIGIRAALSKVPVRLWKNGNDIVPDVPLGWQHAARLTRIGRTSLPVPNVQDHMIARVLQALSVKAQAA